MSWCSREAEAWALRDPDEKAEAVRTAIAAGARTGREIAEAVGAPSRSAVLAICRRHGISTLWQRQEPGTAAALRFRSDLARLFALDRHVLVEADVIDAEEEAWDRFREDPVRAALTLPDDRLFRLHRLLAEGRKT
ncbi:hypothetical protein [Afifella aestuarii]|uniref:hypothetical protein n=1 Tax=Afifella aestuarii TaxID=1909496 RepID=UPI000FE307CA|nr:hypothetical protein [Afifella aestuarii]